MLWHRHRISVRKATPERALRINSVRGSARRTLPFSLVDVGVLLASKAHSYVSERGMSAVSADTGLIHSILCDDCTQARTSMGASDWHRVENLPVSDLMPVVRPAKLEASAGAPRCCPLVITTFPDLGPLTPSRIRHVGIVGMLPGNMELRTG